MRQTKVVGVGSRSVLVCPCLFVDTEKIFIILQEPDEATFSVRKGNKEVI